MKAFIHGVREDGTDYLGTGFPKGGMVSGEYKNIKNLIRYSLGGRQGKFHIEAYYDYANNKYGKADIDIVVTV